MRIMQKIKELLVDRDKLARYDELTKWKEIFKIDSVIIKCTSSIFPMSLPDYIKQIIISALDAEIKELDEE